MLKFKGWWSADEKKDCPEPWETFTVFLHGSEAGDFCDDDKTINAALKASGYRLKLERIES